MSEIRRVIILGESGFIGSHLMKFFCDKSSEIELIGRSFPLIDLTKEKESFALADFFDMETAVVMCAAVKRQFGDNQENFLRNLTMVMNLFHILQDHPVRRLVYFSSAAVYGEDIHNMKITEETPIHPKSYYGIAKYASECLLRKVIDNQKQNSLLILRPSLIYGPGDDGESYGPSGFIRAAVRREKITLWGDGTEQREFIFIEDLTKIVYRLTFHKYDGVVNVASGKSYTFRDALEIISCLAPFELQSTSRLRTKEK